MQNILNGLNEKQVEAVRSVDGPVLVIAGPGSGKTRALTHRIAYMIASGIDPENILAVTFTNKAAEEMQERVKRLVENKKVPLIGTFHSVCARILRKEIGALGYSGDFLIYDESDQLNLIKKSVEAMNIDAKKFNPQTVLGKISALKNDLILPDEFSEKKLEFFDKTVSGIYSEYQNKLKSNNALDFDDLLLLAVVAFKKYPKILEKYQNKFKYILIDEFQDTNKANYVFIKLLSQKSKNILAVGDDAQGIFGWRGADIRNILSFKTDYPEAKLITLDQNYRSTQNILQAATSVIGNNVYQIKKTLWTENGKGEEITAQETPNEKREGDFVVAKIKILRGAGHKLSDFAVFYRTHAQSRILEESLVKSGIPYQIVRGLAFYQRKEIKDMIAYLRLVANPYDVLSFERIYNVPPRGIGPVFFKKIIESHKEEGSIIKYLSTLQSAGDKKIKKISDLARQIEDLAQKSKRVNLPELAKQIVKLTGLESYIYDKTIEGESRWENLKELFTVLQKYEGMNAEEGLKIFLQEASLMQDTDSLNKKGGETVKLMTLHAAKGLEFPIVFMTGMEEGIFPHSRSYLNSSELEEERRLCYVGITRAKERLFFTYCTRRNLYGSGQYNPPSRFLFEIPSNLTNFITLSPYRTNDFSDGGDYEDETINY